MDMTNTEIARYEALTAKLEAFTRMAKSESRTRAIRSLKLSLKALRGEQVPAWMSA